MPECVQDAGRLPRFTNVYGGKRQIVDLRQNEAETDAVQRQSGDEPRDRDVGADREAQNDDGDRIDRQSDLHQPLMRNPFGHRSR